MRYIHYYNALIREKSYKFSFGDFPQIFDTYI